MSQELLVHILAGTAHVGEQGNAYFAGTAHVGEQVQTIQRSKLELHMWQKRVEPKTGTAHVGKCFPADIEIFNPITYLNFRLIIFFGKTIYKLNTK